MTDLKNTTAIVKAILETEPQTRNSDSYLYLKVLEYISEKEGFALGFMTVPYFLENMKDYGYPPFESVRRTRQKLQATFPELAACPEVEKGRMENEKVYRSFARGDLE